MDNNDPLNEKIGKILFDTIPDMLAILDKDGKIIQCNKQLEKATSYEKHELIGLVGHVDLVFDEDIEKAQSSFEQLKIHNTRPNIPLRMKRKNNSIFPSVWSGATLRDESDNIEGYLVIGKDLTAVKNLEEEVIQLKKEKCDEKLLVIGELSARLAHDIRNPLSIIKISLDNFKLMYGMDDSKQKYMNRLNRSVDRITHQVDRVLDFVKNRPLELNKVNLSEIITESIDSLTIPNNIQIIFPKKDTEIICDKKQFVIVMSNLILNGIQAIDGPGTIKITCEKNNDSIIIQVIDSGMEVSNKNMNNLFEPLFTTKQTGTGLGLASVKSIIEAHGGTVSATFSPTVFTITLPLLNIKLQKILN